MSMSTNPRFIKRTMVNEDNSATIKPAPRGFPVLVDERDTGYAPTEEVTMPPCAHSALSEEVKEPSNVIDKYDVPYDDDFDRWFEKWEAQEAQRIIDGAPIRYNQHGKEIDEDLEEYLCRVQMYISGGSCKSNPKKHLALTDGEEAGPVERKRRCLPPPLPKCDTTEEVLKDTKYLAPAESQRSRTPMQGIPATAAVYQGLCSKTNREQNTADKATETTSKATNAKNSISQPSSKPPGWPESLPPPRTSRACNGRRSTPLIQPPTVDGNGEKPSASSESETPSAIEYYQGFEAYIQTDTPYAPGPVTTVTNSRRDLNIRFPGNRRGSNFLSRQRHRISPGLHGPGNLQGNGGRPGYLGARGRKVQKNRGYSHRHNL